MVLCMFQHSVKLDKGETLTKITTMPQQNTETKYLTISSKQKCTDDFIQSITFQTYDKSTEEDDVMEEKEIPRRKTNINSRSMRSLALGASSSGVSKLFKRTSSKSILYLSNSSIILSRAISLQSLKQQKNIISMLSSDLSDSMEPKVTTKPTAVVEGRERRRVVMGTTMLRRKVQCSSN